MCGVWFWYMACRVRTESAGFYCKICNSESLGVYFASGLGIRTSSARDIGITIGEEVCALVLSIYVEPSKCWADLNTRRTHDSIYGRIGPPFPRSPTTSLVLVEGGGHAGEDLVDGLAVHSVESCGGLVEEITLPCNLTNQLRGFIKNVIQLLEPGGLEGVPVLLGAPEKVAIVL